MLKVDINGSEFELFHGIMDPVPCLPMQMSIKLHFGTPHMKFFTSQRSSIHMTILFYHLAKLGYAPFSRDDKLGDGCCSEYSLLRVEETSIVPWGGMIKSAHR